VKHPSDVVPANAGTHTPRPVDGALTATNFFQQWITGIMDPCVRRDDEWLVALRARSRFGLTAATV